MKSFSWATVQGPDGDIAKSLAKQVWFVEFSCEIDTMSLTKIVAYPTRVQSWKTLAIISIGSANNLTRYGSAYLHNVSVVGRSTVNNSHKIWHVLVCDVYNKKK